MRSTRALCRYRAGSPLTALMVEHVWCVRGGNAARDRRYGL